MIPTFPNFKHLDIEDKAEIQAFTKCFPPYSDFNFASLWCWDTQKACRLSMLRGNLVIQLRDYLTGEPILAFLGNQHVAETTATLLDFASEQMPAASLRLVPESVVLSDGKTFTELFLVELDESSFDYIFEVSHLIALDKPDLSSKRRRIKKLQREQPQLEIFPLNISEPSIAYRICRLCETWRVEKGRDDGEFETERLAIERCLSFAAHFQFQAFGARMGESLVGFTINEAVHDGYYMGHFGKCDPRFRGISDLLESETARFMRDLGCSQMNFQQDLGLPGLRQYKRSWVPSAFLRKFYISRRSLI